jgi:hypothetical protein
MGRTNSITGSTISLSGAHSAERTPRASAARAARPNPSATRASEVTRCMRRLPSRSASPATRTTSPGVGTSAGFVTSRAWLP